MACDIGKVLDRLLEDKSGIGVKVRELVEFSELREANKLEISELLSQKKELSAGDNKLPGVTKEISDLRKEVRGARDKMNTRIKFLTKATITLPTLPDVKPEPKAKPKSKSAERTVSEVITEGRKNNIIPNVVADALEDLFNSIEDINFLKNINNVFDPLRHILTSAKDLPFSQYSLSEEIKEQDNPGKDFELEYTEKASSFIGDMEKVIRKIYKTGFVLNEQFIMNTPELAYLAKKSEDGKSLPKDVANALLRAAVKVISGKTSTLNGEATFNPNIGKDLLGISFLNNKDIEALHGLGMPRATLITQLATVIKEELEIDGTVNTESFFMPSQAEGKVDLKVNAGTLFEELLAQQLAGVLVMELENSGILEENGFEKDTKGVSGDTNIKDVPFSRFKKGSKGNVDFDLINNSNAAKRLMPYVDSIFGKKADKQGFYLAEDTKEPIQKRLPNGQKLSDKSTKVLETIRDEITFEVNPGMLPILDLTSSELIELFGLDMQDIPPVALLELGFSKEEISHLYYATVEPMWDVNKAYERRINRLHAVNSLGVLKFKGKILQKIETIRTLQTLQPIAKEAISMDAKIGNNTRTYLKVFGTASTQADKLLRHILQTANMFQELTIDEDSKKFGLWKLDMVQALGSFVPKGSKFVAEDKNTPKRTTEEFPGIVENIETNHKDLMKIVDKLVVGETLTPDDITKLGAAIDFTDGHTISGLMDLSRYLTAKNEVIGKKRSKAGKKRTFKSSVSAESDGATSGVAFKVAQNGTLEQAARLMLVTGQITNVGLEQLKDLYKGETKKLQVIADMQKSSKEEGYKLATLQGLNEAGITVQDAYQQTVIDFVSDMQDSNPALFKVLTTLYGELTEKKDGNIVVTKAGRDFAKQPQMQFLYGQQAEGLSDFLGSLAGENLVADLVSSLKPKATKVEDLRTLFNDINAAIKTISDAAIDKDSSDVTALNAYLISEEDIKLISDNSQLDKIAASKATKLIQASVSALVGGGLFSALTSTFKDFSAHDELVKEAYNTTFVLAESIRLATDMANKQQSPVGKPKVYKDAVSDTISELFDFLLGNTDGQQLPVSKRGVDSSPYETGLADNTILEGGNKQTIYYGVNSKGKPRSISVRASSPSRVSAVSSILPGDTHNRDAVVMMSPIIELKINQIYDAAIASGATRVAAEILADIGFYQETYKQRHVVDYALDAISRTSSIYDGSGTIPEEILKHLDEAITKVARSNGLSKTYDTLRKITDKLDTLKNDLAKAKKVVDKNKQEKIDDLKTLSQYGVNSFLVFEEGHELVAIIFSSNGVDTRIEELGGKPIKGMALNEVKVNVAQYFSDTFFDDVNVGVDAHVADTNIVVKEVSSLVKTALKEKIDKKALEKEAKAVDEKAFKERVDNAGKQIAEEKKAEEIPVVTDEDLAAEAEALDKRMEEASNIFESLGDNTTNEIISDIEAEQVSLISEKTVGDIFERMIETSSKPSEITFLNNMMNTLILPILEENEFLLIDLLEAKGVNTKGARGHVSIRKDAHLDTIVIYHPTTFNGSDQSSTEVYVHELVHIFSKYLFADTRISHSWEKERKLIEGLFHQVEEMITEDNVSEWFGTGTTAKAQYEHIFVDGTMNKKLAEFTSYALSNAKFGQNMNLKLNDLGTDILEASDSNLSIVDKLMNWVKGAINKLFNRKEGLATDMIRNILLEMNGVNIKKKGVLARAVESVTQNLRTLDFKLRYYSKSQDEQNEIMLKATSLLYISRDYLPNVVGNISDRGNIGILMADLLPSADNTIPYVDHAIEARTKTANVRDVVQKGIMNKILKPDEKGETAIDYSQDEQLKDLVLDLDLQALYAVQGVTVNDIIDLFLNKKNDTIKDKLVREINKVYKFNSTEMIDLNKDVKNLAEGLVLRKERVETHSGYTFINANQVAKLHAFRKTKTATSKGINELETLVDALASLYAIEKIPNSRLSTYSDIFSTMSTAVEDVIKTSHSIVSKVRDTNTGENASRIKGRYDTVKDDTGYIIPVVDTPFVNVSSDYQEVDSYEVSKGVRVIFYKVTRSVLQNRDKGSIDTIEYGDNSGVSLLESLTDPDVQAIIKGINKAKDIPYKEEMFIFEHNAVGDVTDIKLRVPERMEQETLNIDNRASVTLAHAEGRYAEAEASHEYNDKWVDIANKDYQDNFAKHPKDFIWISRTSKDKELKGHYDILTDRMKNKVIGTPIAAGAKDGMWIRKNVIRLNFGGQGKSLVDLLQTYGVDSKLINKAVRLAERELLRISRIFKLEIVGKTYEVIMGNIISNVLLETIKGRNPIEVVKTMFEGMVEIDKLNTYRKELANLKLAKEASKNIDHQYKIGLQMEALNKKINASPVKYLDDAGFNSSFVEDVVTKDSVYLSPFEKRMYEKLGSSPALSGLKKTFDFMYMNKGTTMGEAFNRMVIASDAGSRYASDVLDTKYMERDIKEEFAVFAETKDGYSGYSKRDKAEMFNAFRNIKVKEFEKRRKKDLLEQHIDYALRSGDILTALDKLSYTPFFKFKQRIGKVLYKRYADHPATALVVGSFLAYVDGIDSMSGVDFERAEESFWAILSETSGSPIDHLQELASPAIWDNLASMGLV